MGDEERRCQECGTIIGPPSQPCHDPIHLQKLLDQQRLEIEGLRELAERIYDEAPWFCNKCGFYGATDEPGLHPNCSYLAAKAPTGWQLHNAVLALSESVKRDESK